MSLYNIKINQYLKTSEVINDKQLSAGKPDFVLTFDFKSFKNTQKLNERKFDLKAFLRINDRTLIPCLAIETTDCFV